MKAMLKGAATVMALCGMMGQALASGACARSDEAMALKTAAMQQELMVAALYCNDVGLYNRFVVSYQRDLQDSDAALLSFFVHGHGGATAYHAYKTNLANDFSLSGLHGMQSYCSAANAAFGAALNPRGPATLASFIAAQDVDTEGYRACDTSVAGGEMVAGGSSRYASNRKN
ncbi:MAG TPA: hypothetical protein VMF58_14215 [Rhizomicrobium sp.]|nr:hypothetical protein [Rhizomicrobium sp.]